MALSILDGITHGSSGYKRGCRCGICRRAKAAERAAENKRRAERRAAEIAGEQPAPAGRPVTPADPGTPASGSTTSAPGEVERATREQLELHSGVQGIAALSAVALRLAQSLDDPAATGVAGTARQLVATLTEIGKVARGTDDRLDTFFANFGRPTVVPAEVRDSA